MNLAQRLVVAALRCYRCVVSPAKTVLFGPLGRCRYDPVCSVYALEAVRQHGVRRGLWLTARRLCRCHPWGGCGHDPVPPPRPARAEKSARRPRGGLAARPTGRAAEPSPHQGLVA